MSHWRRARLASRCPASIYIWANSSKFQSVPLATSTSCESVPCTPVYSRLNTFFNQDVPLAKSTSCGTVPCTPLWFLQISIKMSHWRRVRLTGRCHAGTSSFFFFGDVVPHIASCGILHGQQCSCHPSTQGFNLVCYPPMVDSSKGAQTGLIANIG